MEQVLYPLPDGWSLLELGEICDFQGGAQPPKSEFIYEPKEGYTRFIQIRDFSSDKNLTYIPVDSTNRFCNEDDILIGRYGASVGKILTGLEGAYNVALIKTLPNESIIYKPFFRRILESSIFQYPLLSKTSSRAAQAGFNKNDIGGILFPIPPLNEQKRIVEKLDALLTRIDTAIEHLQQSVTLADALYASELNEIFPTDADIESLSDKDGWVPLSDICTFENGDRGKNYPSKSAFVAEGIPVVSAGNLGERYIDHKGLNYITPERYDLLRSGRIRMGDILFCLRGSLGKVAISKDIDEGVIASSLVIIRPKEYVEAEYIYKYLKSSLCQQFISYYNNGAAQPNLSAKSLGKFMLPLPNSEKQKVIAEGLDEKYQLNEKLHDGLKGKIISLQNLKASILDSAFKGEL